MSGLGQDSFPLPEKKENKRGGAVGSCSRAEKVSGIIYEKRVLTPFRLHFLPSRPKAGKKENKRGGAVGSCSVMLPPGQARMVSFWGGDLLGCRSVMLPPGQARMVSFRGKPKRCQDSFPRKES